MDEVGEKCLRKNALTVGIPLNSIRAYGQHTTAHFSAM